MKRLQFRHRLEDAAAALLFSLFRALPTPVASALGGQIAQGLGAALSVTRKVGLRNLVRVWPQQSRAQHRRTLSAVWNNLGRLAAEYPLIHRYAPGGPDAHRITLTGHEALAARAHAGQPALLFTIHSANWEISTIPLAHAARPLSVVYRAPNNPLIARRISAFRAPFLKRLIAKGNDAARDMIRALKAGEHVAVLMDQKLNTGVDVPFFGHPAATAPTLVALSLRMNVPIFPVQVIRKNGCDFEVRVHAPVTPASSDDRQADVQKGLCALNKIIESWITAHPGQWLWLHRRWPKSFYQSES